MSTGETGWILDLGGEAINLAHVRRIRIGSRFQERVTRHPDEPDGVTLFYVEAEMAGVSCGDPRPTLVQNLETRESAEHWVASRFWQPMAGEDRRPITGRSAEVLRAMGIDPDA